MVGDKLVERRGMPDRGRRLIHDDLDVGMRLRVEVGQHLQIIGWRPPEPGDAQGHRRSRSRRMDRGHAGGE